jgi:hypothetical protein
MSENRDLIYAVRRAIDKGQTPRMFLQDAWEAWEEELRDRQHWHGEEFKVLLGEKPKGSA